MTLGEMFPHLKADPRFAEVAAMDEAEAFGPTPEPTPASLPVAESVRLARARNACPASSKAEDCGCSDDRLCSRNDGARVSRDVCYRCLAEAPPTAG